MNNSFAYNQNQFNYILQHVIVCISDIFILQVNNFSKWKPITNFNFKLLEWKAALKNTKFHEDFEPNSSVLDCLRYSCRDHWGASEGDVVSPAMLLRQHEITPRQYQMVALECRVAANAWEDIDSLLLSKVQNPVISTQCPFYFVIILF